jgi:hypothetical protein
MRALTRNLLSTCAVCTVAQGHHAARAQPDPTADQPSPTNPTSPTTPVAPGDPRDTSTPTDPAPADPAPPDPAPPDQTDPATTDTGQPGPGSDDGSDRRTRSGIGVAITVGGGVTGFTDKTMRDRTSSVGGLWDLRITIGSNIPLGIDVNYMGSAANITGLLSGQSGTLIGTTVEGALRYNILPHARWTPYIFAGAGWQRYDVTSTKASLVTSGLNDTDNLLEFPLGAGVSYRGHRLMVDVRGTFRATRDQNLVLTTPALSPTSNDYAPMHTWAASAAIGYQF